MSKAPPPAPTASAIGPCPTVIKIVGRPGTGSLPSTIAPPDHPLIARKLGTVYMYKWGSLMCQQWVRPFAIFAIKTKRCKIFKLGSRDRIPSYFETRKRPYANSVDPDQTPHDVASDQGPPCLLTRFSIKYRIKSDKIDQTPLKWQMDSSNI